MALFDTAREEARFNEARDREEEDVAKILSDKYGLAYTDLSLIPVDVEALRTIPEAKARAAEVVAFARAGAKLSVAVHNPNNPAVATLIAELAANKFVVTQYLVSKRSIDKAFARYADLSYASESKRGVFDISAEALDKVAGIVHSIKDLQGELERTRADKTLERVSHAIELVLGAALSLRASDIHFEPEEDKVRLRLRLDGLLTDAFFFDPESFRLIASRIKLLSGVKLNVVNRAQDGRFSIQTGKAEVEIRSSFIPEPYGESIVLRVLDPNALKLSIETLGINAKAPRTSKKRNKKE
jgi:type II secretory ATPase GspE/PulE/Tfp pilus assembly ATPase PilB-like protein